MNSRPRAQRPRDIAECVAGFLKEGDLEGIVSMFHPECRIFFPPEQPPRVGLRGVRDAFGDFVILRPTLISEVKSEVAVADIALLQAAWRIENDAGEVVAQGLSTEVARQFDHGGWGYLIDCPMGPPTGWLGALEPH